MSTNTQGKPCILYLDDNAAHREEFTTALSTHFTIHTAGSGEEGNALLRQHDIQAVVAGIDGEDGAIINFFSEIRASFQDVFRLLVVDKIDSDIMIKAVNQAHVYHADWYFWVCHIAQGIP